MKIKFLICILLIFIFLIPFVSANDKIEEFNQWRQEVGVDEVLDREKLSEMTEKELLEQILIQLQNNWGWNSYNTYLLEIVKDSLVYDFQDYFTVLFLLISFVAGLQISQFIRWWW